MGTLAVVMFAGITALAVVAKVHMAENPSALVGLPAGAEQKTALSQLGLAVFGHGIAFYLLQAFTAAILVLAANTAYNGFPVLASILQRDGYLPRQLSRRGDRLVFSNGIVLLTGVAGLLIVAFDAQVTRLIQLYIIGVFVSFTLSQLGMVRHWQKERARAEPAAVPVPGRAGGRRSTRSAPAATAVVLVIVLRDQVRARRLDRRGRDAAAVPADEGDLPALRGRAATSCTRRPGGVPLPSRVHAVVLVSKLHAPTLQALAYAKATRPHDLVALTVRTDPAGDRGAAARVGGPRRPRRPRRARLARTAT